MVKARKAVQLRETEAGSSRSRYLIVTVLIAVTLAAYFPVLRCDWAHYDDDAYVLENPNIQHGLTWQSLRWAFTSLTQGNWHPLTWMSHTLDWTVFGSSPAGHHAVNLLLHLANTLLLFAVLRRMTRSDWRSGLVAVLFAVHPLHVESVAWIAERKDVLSTLFGLLTIWAYARYAESPSIRRYMPVLVFFALGLMSKPMLVTLPLVLLLLDYWPLGRMSATRTRGRLVVEKIPMLLFSAVSSAITYIAQQRGGAIIASDLLPLPLRIENALTSYVEYVLLMVWPAKLAVLYPHPEAALPAWLAVIAGVALISATFLALRSAVSRPHLATGWLWYLVMLVPVIGIVQVGSQALADRYTYVPLVGLFIIVVWSLPEYAFRPDRRHHDPRSRVVMSLAVAVVLVLVVCTNRQLSHWHDDLALFGRAIAVTKGNSIAESNLGHAMERRGDVDGAMVHFLEAVRLNPRYPDAQFNVAHVLVLRGKPEEAIVHYSLGLEEDANDAKAISEMGVAYAKLGRWDEAISCYRRALRARSDDSLTFFRMGLAMIGRGDFAGSVEWLGKAIKLKSDWPEAHNNIAAALLQLNRREEAIGHLLTAVRLRPDYGIAHKQLANAYYLLGDYPAAWREVSLARKSGAELDERFLSALTSSMPEPR